jgi:hypothetical protein
MEIFLKSVSRDLAAMTGFTPDACYYVALVAFVVLVLAALVVVFALPRTARGRPHEL